MGLYTRERPNAPSSAWVRLLCRSPVWHKNWACLLPLPRLLGTRSPSPVLPEGAQKCNRRHPDSRQPRPALPGRFAGLGSPWLAAGGARSDWPAPSWAAPPSGSHPSAAPVSSLCYACLSGGGETSCRYRRQGNLQAGIGGISDRSTFSGLPRGQHSDVKGDHKMFLPFLLFLQFTHTHSHTQWQLLRNYYIFSKPQWQQKMRGKKAEKV